MTMAIVHGVTAVVCGNDKGVRPWAIEERRQGVRFVVIVEAGDDVSAKPAVTLKSADIEQGWDIRYYRNGKSPA